jgi:hypothetical protein
MTGSFMLGGKRGGSKASGAKGRRKWLHRPAIIAAALLADTIPTWARTHRIAGNFVVRCQQGHLFETIWIPGASVKSLRFGLWRFQRCPVGNHWSFVTPVRESDLSESERQAAHEHRDIRLP